MACKLSFRPAREGSSLAGASSALSSAADGQQVLNKILRAWEAATNPAVF
jgi:hypothetical protein